MVNGAQCVMITGTLLMVLWSADSLAIVEVYELFMHKVLYNCTLLSYALALDIVGVLVFGAGSDQIWLDEVQCFGLEDQLLDCNSSDVGVHDCSHFEDAGVRCRGTSMIKIVVTVASCI